MSTSKTSPEVLLQRLEWTVIRRLDGILQGDYRSLFYGFGLDLAELREYQFSDDVRYIDWNVTARMQTPYVRQFLEDREINAWFLLDLSPSVDFGTVKTLKRNLLVDFVSVLSRLLTRHGNRIGAITYNGKIENVIPVQSGKMQVMRIMNSMLTQPKLKHTPPTDLSVLLKTALGTIKRRSLVFIISDFISAPGWDKALNMLAQRHEVLAIRLSDPREIDLPDMGTLIMEDAETGEQLFVDTSDRKFRQRFNEAAQKRRYNLEVALRRAGVNVLTLSTDDDLVKSVLKFAILRKRQKSAPASFARGGSRAHSQFS